MVGDNLTLPWGSMKRTPVGDSITVSIQWKHVDAIVISRVRPFVLVASNSIGPHLCQRSHDQYNDIWTSCDGSLPVSAEGGWPLPFDYTVISTIFSILAIWGSWGCQFSLELWWKFRLAHLQEIQGEQLLSICWSSETDKTGLEQESTH